MMGLGRRLDAEDRGASLVEVLVAIVLAAIVGGAALTGLVSMARTQGVVIDVQENLNASRIAMDRLRQELRGARRVLADPSGRRLQFWMDHNDDQLLTADEIVTYEMVATGGEVHLERYTAVVGATRQVLASNLVWGTPFAYTPAAPATRMVDVTLTVDAGTIDVGPAPFTITAQVRVRNVK